MSRVDAYARVYAAGVQAYISLFNALPLESRQQLNKTESGMDRARGSGEQCVLEFRELLKKFPECNEPERPAIPETITTDPDVGKF